MAGRYHEEIFGDNRIAENPRGEGSSAPAAAISDHRRKATTTGY
jgi:hypothetical protein